VVIIVVVVVAAVAVVGSLYYLGTINRSSILSRVHTTNIVNGLITVQAGSWNSYEFSIQATATNAYLAGTFYASGGAGNDITVYVMTQTDFINWKNGHASNTYYNSGELTTSSFTTNLPAGDTYDLVYSNTNAIFSSKNVQTSANLLYTL